MVCDTVLCKTTQGITHITLNRPATGNSLNARMSQELITVLTRVRQGEDVKVVIISGAGDTFCVGDESPPVSGITEYNTTSPATVIAGLDCPVIAAINGNAFGSGLELALACDIRIASDKALLALPQINTGLMPCDGGTQRLPRLIGRTRAMEMILLGEPVSADEAYRIGLVNRVVSVEELSDVVNELALGITFSAPLALKFAKETIDQGMEMTLEQGLRLEADLYSLLQTTEDRTEGITAFKTKKRPEFKGK